MGHRRRYHKRRAPKESSHDIPQEEIYKPAPPEEKEEVSKEPTSFYTDRVLTLASGIAGAAFSYYSAYPGDRVLAVLLGASGAVAGTVIRMIMRV